MTLVWVAIHDSQNVLSALPDELESQISSFAPRILPSTTSGRYVSCLYQIFLWILSEWKNPDHFLTKRSLAIIGSRYFLPEKELQSTVYFDQTYVRYGIWECTRFVVIFFVELEVNARICPYLGNPEFPTFESSAQINYSKEAARKEHDDGMEKTDAVIRCTSS